MSVLRLRQATSSETATPAALEEIWAQMFSQLGAEASASGVSGTGSSVSSSAVVGQATGVAPSAPVFQTTVVETVYRTTTAQVTVSADPVTIVPTPSETPTSTSVSTPSSVSTTPRDTSSKPTESSSSTTTSSRSSDATTLSIRSRTLFLLDTTSTASSTTTSYTPVPPGILSFDPPSTSPTTTTSSSQDTNLISAPMPTMPSMSDNNNSSGSGLSASSKRAIVGSLAGAIGGLILIGLVMCIFLRRRHKREEEEEAPKDELKEPKPPRYHMVRKWSDFTLQTERSTPEIIQGSQPSAPDGSVIRVSTDHWKRPFARDDGLRESQGPAQLRIVNPDNSRSSSPMVASDEKRRQLPKQHPALRAAYNHVRARTNSRSQVPTVKPVPIAQPQPVYVNDVQKSRAAAISKPRHPQHSTKSSSSTQAIVRPHPLEDPFVSSVKKPRYSPPSSKQYSPPRSSPPRSSPPRTSPLSSKSPPSSGPKRPSLQKLSTSMNRLSNTINPFRSKTIPSNSLPPFQGYIAPELGFWDPRGDSQSAYSVSPPPPLYASLAKKIDQIPRDPNVPRVREATGRGSGHVVKKSDPFDLLISPSTRDNGQSNLVEKSREDERVQRERESRRSQGSSPPNWVAYEGT